MTNRELFIDAMNGIDAELLEMHIQRKYPTKAQKIRHYVAAAAVYAAACLVIAAVLPFIIGHGDTPAPVPGDDPVKVDTTVPVPDEPEVKSISIKDIDEIYNNIDSENLPNKVTRAEVENIISAARQAYIDYDVIILSDGTKMVTSPQNPGTTLEKIEAMTDVDRESTLKEYSEYFDNMFEVVEGMLQFRFNENSIYRMYLENERDPCIYLMDLEVTGCSTAEEWYGLIREDNSPYTEWIYTRFAEDTQVVYYLNSLSEEHEMLYPSAQEYKTYEKVAVWRAEQGMLESVSEFDGLRYTLTLDKDSYGLYDTISVSIYIENIGDETVTLWQPVLSHFISDVRFYENGVEKPEFYDRQVGYDEAEESRLLGPGQAVGIKRFFTPGAPSIDGMEQARLDSKWEITAYVYYLPYPHEKLADLPVDELKTGSVTIEVPHDVDAVHERR